MQNDFDAEEWDVMTIVSFRADAACGADAVRGSERSPKQGAPRSLRAVGRALAGIALALASLCAQGATDSPDTAPAHAAAPAPVSVTPEHIELSNGNPTVVVTVHNDNHSRAMVVVLQPMIWTEGGVAPHYALTPDVVAKPATFTVPPGTTQAVEVELQSTAADLSGQDLQLFWRAQAEPWGSTHASDERAAP